MPPLLSICIPTFERAPFLERCLTALEKTAELGFECEVVVSDNASTDDTIAVLEAHADRLDLRWAVQARNVGAEANVVSALRMARGRYCVYLADDDALEWDRVTEILQLFEASPGLVCVQAPWRSWDDENDRDLGPFYRLPGPAAFGKTQTWPCWQYLLQNSVFPEIGIYRTDSLLPILHLPRTLHWAFVWCFRLLSQGTVAFDPLPFYRHVVRAKADLPPRVQLGVTQATTHLDRYRGGLEWALAGALRQSVGHVPIEHRQRAMALLDAFQAQRAEVASRVSAQNHDFVAAVEHFTRSVVWQAGVDAAPLQQFERQHTMLAGVQALVAAATGSAGIDRIVLCGLPNIETVVTLIHQVFEWEGAVDVHDAPIPTSTSMILVADNAARSAWLDAGASPGHLLAWDELADCFRVHNPLGALCDRAALRGAA